MKVVTVVPCNLQVLASLRKPDEPRISDSELVSWANQQERRERRGERREERGEERRGERTGEESREERRTRERTSPRLGTCLA